MEYKNQDKKATGEVKWFSPEKGFGFIHTEEYGDIFVYYNDIITDGFKTLSKGQRVNFDIVQGERGLQAGNIILI